MDDRQPIISIIVPVYNAEKYLARCIDSILSQSLKNIEVILVDDGSVDQSKSIENDYRQRDERIVVVHQENQGVSAARNNGISKARGKFVGFIDADDTMDPNMLEQMTAAIRESDSDICVTGYKVVSEYKTEEYPIPFSGVMDKKRILEEYCPLLIGRESDFRILGTVWRCLYSEKLIGTLRFCAKIKLMEDALFNLGAFMKAERVCFIQGVPYNYFVFSESATNRYRSDYEEQMTSIETELLLHTNKLEDQGVAARSNYYATVFDMTVYALKNVKKADNPGSFAEKLKSIKRICTRKTCREAVTFYKGIHRKERLLIMLIRLRMYVLMYLFL